MQESPHAFPALQTRQHDCAKAVPHNGSAAPTPTVRTSASAAKITFIIPPSRQEE
jgi:hypothetical protein